MMKKCSTCGKIVAIDECYKNKSRPDGHSHDCKECDRARALLYSKTDRGRITQRKYRQSKKGKKRAKSLPRKYQRKAHKAVRDAIGRGEIKQASTMPCSQECGGMAMDYHHYNGYDKEYWLDVVPVCRKCHHKIHAMIKVKQHK